MFHPETLSLFLSTLALWLCVRTFAEPALRLGARRRARRRPARARVRALDGRRRRARAPRRPPLAPARGRARARGADPGAVVHPPAAHLRRPAGVPAAGARSSDSRSSFYVDPGLPASSRRPFARTTTCSRSRRPTTASGATTSGVWAWHAG